MTSTDVANLHAAILADPSDLAARYAYADALDEAGSDRRAAFVRASLAGDHVEASTLLDPLTWWTWFGNPQQDAADRERRLRVNVQAQPDGVMVHVWAKGDRIRWGYQAVIRNGLIDEYRGPIASWLEGVRDFHPVTVYRPTWGRRQLAHRPGNASQAIRLWQDERVSLLHTLDLRAVCRDAESSGYFHVCHRHVFRPWRGLGRVALPFLSPSWATFMREQWGARPAR